MNSILEKEYIQGDLEIMIYHDSHMINKDALEILSQYEPHIDASIFPGEGFISIDSFCGTTKNFNNFINSLNTLHNSTDTNISGTGVIKTRKSVSIVSFNSGNYQLTRHLER